MISIELEICTNCNINWEIWGEWSDELKSKECNICGISLIDENDLYSVGYIIEIKLKDLLSKIMRKISK